MAFEDEELISMLRTAFETVQSSISSSYSERLDIHFYAVSYTDPVIIQTINEWVLKNRSASSLRCLWFYDTLTEKSFGKEWSGLLGIQFTFVDAEPDPIYRQRIQQFNDKAVNSGLYYRLVSNPENETLIIEASQHAFFRYVDFTFCFESVEYCDLKDQQQWTDDYSLQWIFVEWEEALEFCAKNQLVMQEGSMLIRWLIPPLENPVGYILCQRFSIDSKWL